MLAFLVIWTLCCVSSQTALCGLPTGSSTGGDRQGDGPTIAPSLRKLLQRAEPKVAGGKDAPKDRFPYACSLKIVGSQTHACGGTLIAPKWVLTAAHCVTGEGSLGPTPLVCVGAYEIDGEACAEIIQAVDVFIHERYTGNVMDGFDIALLLLEEPSTKQPASLAHSEQRLGVGQLLATIGWGRTSERGQLPAVLQLTDQLEYISNKSCQRIWPNLQDDMLCSSSRLQGTCGGDSGGPLLIPDFKRGNITAGNPKFDRLVGIVSFGPEGCSATRADVYTRVSSFRKWIDEMMAMEEETTCGKDCDEDLYFAAGSGQLSKVKELISKGADPSSTFGELEFTPLSFAAENGHVDIVEVLIEAGADVDSQNEEDVTVLYFAAKEGHLDVVKVLVKAEASVDLKTNNGFTPMMVAAGNGHLDVVEFLLESGADVDAQDDGRLFALYFAAQEGHLDVVKVLIEAGATVDLRGRDGDTALGNAAFQNEIEVAEFLLESGANIDAQNEAGTTPLYFAAHEGHLDVAKVLVKAGATVDLETDKGFTPLNTAAQSNKIKMAEFLLESGADVNSQSNTGTTPLHSAAYAGNPKLVQLLLDSGAEIDAQDEFGFTAIFDASYYGSGEAIEVLKKAGADLSIKSNEGNDIEDVICLCSEVTSGLKCREGTCGGGEKKRIKAILIG